MKQAPVDKYNIAWFRLAEYVSRGEKERALGVYRLLSHSLDDVAFARQLEGDILWSFNDTGASDKYHEAAQLYKKDKRLLEAAGVYEHLVTLHPDSIIYTQHLIDVYVALNVQPKIALYIPKLVALLLVHNELEQLTQLVDQLNVYNLTEQKAALYQQVLFGLLQKKHASPELIMLYLQKTVDEFAKQPDQSLQQFLVRLQAANLFYHQKACAYLERNIE